MMITVIIAVFSTMPNVAIIAVISINVIINMPNITTAFNIIPNIPIITMPNNMIVTTTNIPIITMPNIVIRTIPNITILIMLFDTDVVNAIFSTVIPITILMFFIFKSVSPS
ncbi:hypothetical protein ACOMHN_036671 [Nucella lapillus]